MSRQRSGAKSDGKKKARGKAASAWPSFLIAHDAVVWRIEERLKAEGLPEMNWYVVLWVLQSVPEKRLRMNELAEYAVLPRSNATRLVDRMEKAGLVKREPCGSDRRGWYARLLPAGEEMRSRMWKVYGPAVAELFSGQMNSEESAILRGVMERIYENAKKGGRLIS